MDKRDVIKKIIEFGVDYDAWYEARMLKTFTDKALDFKMINSFFSGNKYGIKVLTAEEGDQFNDHFLIDGYYLIYNTLYHLLILF